MQTNLEILLNANINNNTQPYDNNCVSYTFTNR